MAGRTPPTAAASPRPSARIPLVILALALPLLAGGWYARNLSDTLVGPLAVAAGNDGVAVLAPGTLYRLDSAGVLESTDSETVAADIRDAGLAWAGEDLLVSPGAEDQLLRCSAGACAPFSTNTYAPRGPVQTWFDGSRYWFSETEADRIQRYSPEGERIDMPVSDLSRPGSLATHGDLLYVADAGSLRISRYTVHKRGIDVAESFATYSDGDEHDPVNIPRRFIVDGDGFLAVFSNAGRTRAHLVRVDADGNSERLDVAGLENPADIARLGEDTLVVDERLMQVLRINARGESAVFGDDEFQAAISANQRLRDAMLLVSPILIALAVLALSAGGTWLFWALTWRPLDPALVVKPDANGIAWLPAECDVAPQRIPRNLLIACPVAIVPALTLLFATPYAGIAVLWAVLCLGAAAAAPLRTAMQARLPKGERIGIRDRQLIVTHPETGMREYALPQVQWNDQLLRPEPGVDIPLRRGTIPLYHPATVEELLLPRLNLMRKLAP